MKYSNFQKCQDLYLTIKDLKDKLNRLEKMEKCVYLYIKNEYDSVVIDNEFRNEILTNTVNLYRDKIAELIVELGEL